MLEIYFNFPSVIHFLLRVLYLAFLQVECKKAWRPVHLVPSRMCSRENGAGREGRGGGERERVREGESQSAAGELARRLTSSSKVISTVKKDTTLGKQQIQYKVSLTYFIQKQPQVGIDINNSTLLIGVQFGGLYVIKHHIHSVKSFHHKRIDLTKVKRLSEYSANGNKTSLRAFLLKGNKLLYFP